MTFDELFTRWSWKAIHNCPGRYVLTGVPASLSTDALIGHDTEVSEFHVKTARDTVLVVRLEDGGLISYKRADGSYLHTLNTKDGFSRKRLQLGIPLD